MGAHSPLSDVLRGHGHRVTLPRQAVWELLRNTHEHLTVDEIAQRVQRSSPSVHLASVYRSVLLFAELDLMRESQLGDGVSRWELVHPDEHFHVVCRGCGQVTHHVGDLVERIRQHLDTGHGFEAESVELVVSGRCASCAASGEVSKLPERSARH